MTTTSLLAGRYAPGRVLARGATGVVFEATDQRLDRTVAVTMLQAAQAPERFRGQAQRLAALAHPNVVTVFDFGSDEQHAWLVTELLPGPTLQDLLARTGPLPVDAVLTYGEQVAGALAAAHDAGVVHGHLTPATVMLAGDGQCKLVDLGVARLDGAPEATSATPTPLGSSGFPATEVVSGAPATPADDAYAFGAFLFTVLTGHPPVPGDVAVGEPAPAQQVAAAAAHPREHRPDVPAPLDDLVAALLANDAQARPSVAEAGQRLAAVRAATTPDDAATQALTTSLLATRVLAAPAAVDGPQDHRRPRGLPGPGGRRSLTAVAAVVVLLASAALAFAVHGAARTTGRQQQTASGTPVAQPSPTPTTPSPTPTASATTASPDTVSGLLSALQSTVAAAAATGDLAPQPAQELGQRLADVAGSITDGNPGDLARRLADLNRYLARLGRHGQISAGAYTSIASGLQQLAAVVPAPFSGNGGNG